jgi:hypothetical protein
MGQANALDMSLAGNTAMAKDPDAVDASPFEAPDAHNISAAAASTSHVISTHDARLQEGHITQQSHQKRRGLSLFSCCSCFGRGKVKGARHLDAVSCLYHHAQWHDVAAT